MIDNLKKCCQSSPTIYVPMMYGNVQVDPDAKTSIKCESCGRETYGETSDELRDNWNSIDEVE